jgi:effector-binding domain-containing protein
VVAAYTFAANKKTLTMRILKGIGIGLVLIIAVYVILALFGPSKVHVERSTMINASAATIYNEINTLKNWKSWSYWDNIDPNMQSTYEGPEAGVGAKHIWKSENDSVGNGSLTITKSEPNTFVETTLEFEGMGTSVGGWKIADTTGAAKVTTYMDMEIGFLFRPMMLFMNMDEMLGKDFEKSLQNLKAHCEALPSPEMTAEINIEATTMPAMKILYITDSADEKSISQKLGESYGAIQAEMAKQGLTQTGAVFAIYNKVDYRPDGSMHFVMDIGIPVDKAGKNAGNIKYMETAGGNAVRGDHYGPYEATPASHEAMDKWMKNNGKVVTGGPWEVYVTDPGVEPDQSKWLTQIYYPVQ